MTLMNVYGITEPELSAKAWVSRVNVSPGEK